MATDKFDAYINDTAKMAKNIKDAQVALRKRLKESQALIDSGLLDSDQMTRLAAILPKKREPKADA